MARIHWLDLAARLGSVERLLNINWAFYSYFHTCLLNVYCRSKPASQGFRDFQRVWDPHVWEGDGIYI